MHEPYSNGGKRYFVKMAPKTATNRYWGGWGEVIATKYQYPLENYKAKVNESMNVQTMEGRWVRVIGLIFAAGVLAACSDLKPAIKEQAEAPKLVVQITVDQLRADMPQSVRERLPEGGLRYLLDQGVHYQNAHYRHANTETAVGHATLFTGALPAQHGIVANDWIDRKTQAFVYNTEDKEHSILGSKPKPHQGVSPKNLLVPTIGDQLVDEGKGRVFSVSGKDRGAILPGGHRGKAFWYSKSSGKFVTSTYYYQDYPQWVRQWNEKSLASQFSGNQWALSRESGEYKHLAADDRPFEADLLGFGRTFPHSYGDSKYVPLLVGLSPPIDELTIDFALNMINQELIGQKEGTDLLAISLSATDYVGHLYGSGSLESEDNLFRLDRQLAKLFTLIDQRVGLDNTLIVLSADHGAPRAPEAYVEQGLPAGRIALDYFKQENPLHEVLDRELGKGQYTLSHSHPYLYLDFKEPVASEDQARVLQLVAQAAESIPGIHRAMIRSEMMNSNGSGSSIEQLIVNNFHAKRSGAIHLVQDKYWFLHSTDEAKKMHIESLAAIHGSPWEYDTHVPVIFAGFGLRSNSIERLVSPADISGTISKVLGIEAPRAASTDYLYEVMQ